MDLRTEVARTEALLNELALNRRLAPDVYLGCSDIVAGPEGPTCVPLDARSVHPRIGGALLMRRLDEDRMLAGLLRTRGLSPSEVLTLAATVASMHGEAPAVQESEALATADQLPILARENFRDSREGLSAAVGSDLFDGLAALSAVAHHRLLPTLQARAKAGYVLDGS